MSGLWSALKPVDIDAGTCRAWQIDADSRDTRLDLSDDLVRHAEFGLSEAPHVAHARYHLSERAMPAERSRSGHPAFQAALARLALHQEEPEARQAMAATAGGHGAVRLALALSARARAGTTVHVPDEAPEELREAASATGLPLRSYCYATKDGTALAPEQMLSDLRRCRAGDIVILQGCCHNPTGHDLPEALWAAVAAVLLETGAVPLITLAGLGLGLEPGKDSDGVHSLLIALPEVMVAIDCAATFAMGGEAPGLLVVQAADAAEAGTVMAHLDQLTAGLTGHPAQTGTAVVSEILHRALLTEEWTRVLRRARQHLASMRADLAAALRDATGQDNWDHIATGRGPFLRLPLSAEQIETLGADHAIYLRADGRANLSALPKSDISRLAEATAQCLGLSAKTVEPLPAQGEAEASSDGSADDAEAVTSEQSGDPKGEAAPEAEAEAEAEAGDVSAEPAEQSDESDENGDAPTDGAPEGSSEETADGAEPTQAA